MTVRQPAHRRVVDPARLLAYLDAPVAFPSPARHQRNVGPTVGRVGTTGGSWPPGANQRERRPFGGRRGRRRGVSRWDYRLRANVPRSAFTNRASLPLTAISRMIAL